MQKAKSAAAQSELAQRLMKLAEGTEAAAQRYALLDKAADLAIEAGDVATALKIIDSLTAAIVVTYDPRLPRILIDAAKKARLPAAHEELAGRLMQSCASQKDEQLALAIELAEEAVASAVKSRNIELRKLAVARQSDMRHIAQARDAISAAFATLDEDVLDPAANLLAGRYYCYTRDNWNWGTNLFLIASDSPDREVVLQELEANPDPLRIADGWRKLSESADGDAANAMQRRAGFWYAKASQQFKGLQQTQAKAGLRDVRGFNVRGKVFEGGGKPPTELISVTDGFSFLSHIAGAWEGSGHSGELVVNDDVWYLTVKGNIGIGATTIRVSESKRFKPVMRKYTWKRGTGPVKMIARSEGFCILTSISGRFEGGGERIHMYIGRDGYWYLDGNAAQGVTGTAVSLQFPGREDFPVEYQQYNWGPRDRGKKRMIHSSEGFCVLTTIGGALEGGGENAGLTIGPGGYWYLGGGTGQASFHLKAISVKLKDGWP